MFLYSPLVLSPDPTQEGQTKKGKDAAEEVFDLLDGNGDGEMTEAELGQR